MKTLFFICIVLIVALRPVLPLLDYTINYTYIRENICENRARPELNCNGKCYLAKQISGSSQNSDKQSVLKLSIISETFTAEDILTVRIPDFKAGADDPYVSDASLYQYLAVSGIFRPPLTS
ncbi:hypothetical protein [Epilithonimonas vandammei]|uniref:hypothetical protein n=1 Tax=Epilithonimonas vandammei TaxID=2487072 RepID=UPI0028AB7545|nr:hypothetical protein [Epilithonimonas vandammei]